MLFRNPLDVRFYFSLAALRCKTLVNPVVAFKINNPSLVDGWQEREMFPKLTAHHGKPILRLEFTGENVTIHPSKSTLNINEQKDRGINTK